MASEKRKKEIAEVREQIKSLKLALSLLYDHLEVKIGQEPQPPKLKVVPKNDNE